MPSPRVSAGSCWRKSCTLAGVEKVLGLAFRGRSLYALEMSTSAGAGYAGPR
jgi:hypothetical protein